MIDLYSVKLNNKYDFVQDAQPIKDGTWLCSKTSQSFKKGYSYLVTGETVERIEIVEDERIIQAIQPTYEVVKKYLGYDKKLKCFEWLKPCDCHINELPLAVDYHIAKMVAYDVFNRSTGSDLKSESIGNYSYTKEDYQVGSLYYPADIISGLDVFKKVKFL